jgi:excisionase family DNA binding protein
MTKKEVRVEERQLSLSEAAGALNISERTAYRWIKSGKLRAYKPGRDYWIPESAIKEVVEESKVLPKAPSRSSLEPSLFNGLDDERRASIFLDAVASAADRLNVLAADRDTNKWRRFGIGDAALALIDAMHERITEDVWETLSNELRLELIDVSEKLVQASTQSIERAEDERREVEAHQARERIREWTERISA